MTQVGHLKGKSFRMSPLAAHVGRQIVSDRTSGRDATINQFQGDGESVRKGVQLIASQDGGVQEAVRGATIDQRLDWDRRLTGGKEMNKAERIEKK